MQDSMFHNGREKAGRSTKEGNGEDHFEFQGSGWGRGEVRVEARVEVVRAEVRVELGWESKMEVRGGGGSRVEVPAPGLIAQKIAAELQELLEGAEAPVPTVDLFITTVSVDLFIITVSRRPLHHQSHCRPLIITVLTVDLSSSQSL
ncbi:unnamed protein product [Boreogadus saida]